ncbi:LysR family transcriptional regulator [Serratia marcescens]
MRKELDLKMLYFFRALYLNGNVSLAADQLDLSQPSGSLLLKRLREEFNDTLFVRVGQKMAPTPCAQQAFTTISMILDLLDNQLVSSLPFDPRTSQRSFTIAMADISQIALVPRLLDICKRQGATQIKFAIRHIDDKIYSALESGDVNLVIGYLTDIPESFYQQRLFDEHYVCLSSTTHPRIRQAPTLASWLKEQQVMVQWDGTGHAEMERYLARSGIQLRTKMLLPSFLGVGNIVASTELLATVPEQVAAWCAAAFPCVAWPLPMPCPSFTIRQVWHQRYHHDPGLIWLRQQLAQLTQAG